MKHLIFSVFLLSAFSSCQQQIRSLSSNVPNAQAFELHGEMKEAIEIEYLQFLPQDYTSKKEWPLLLFLHGAGERGTDLEKVAVHGPPKLASQGELQQFIVIAPQCPEDDYWDSFRQQSNLIDLVHKIKKELKVDPNRIYVTGLSMGGFGTWQLAANLHSEIAAAVPICGGGSVTNDQFLVDMPIWNFHGAKDDIVPIELSQQMIDAIELLGGHPKFTIYPDANHDAWTKTYNNPEVYKWLLQQNLSDRK